MEKAKKKQLSFATLRVTKEVLASKSLTKTAMKLNITQPAVSMHLRKFEECTGFYPLTRVGNEMVVTLGDSVQIIENILSLENKLIQLGRRNERSEKTLGICQFLGEYLVSNTEACRYFINKFRVHLDCSTRLVEMYISRETDIIIRALFPDEDPIFSGYVPYTWAGNFKFGKQHDGPPIRIILPASESPLSKSAIEWLNSNQIPFDLVLECNNSKLISSLCKNLNAISVVPSRLVKNDDFLYANAFDGGEDCMMVRIGLFFHENNTSFIEAEEYFKKFTSHVLPPVHALAS